VAASTRLAGSPRGARCFDPSSSLPSVPPGSPH
jgi:hypothetical protein